MTAIGKTVFHTREDSKTSADVLVPMIIDLISPKSVVDVGCNVGRWLARFKAERIEDILGIDGEYILSEDMLIERDEFVAFDLENIEHVNVNRRFDVALCLECAEHLEESSGIRLVDTLCQLSDQIVFSAAVPGQTGMGHKNEQYPDYWRALFAKHGYVMLDPFRPEIWSNPDVEFWYRQNIYLFSKNLGALKVRIPEWDGKIYIIKELLEMYVRELGTVNGAGILSEKYLERSAARLGLKLVRPKPTLGARILWRLRRLFA